MHLFGVAYPPYSELTSQSLEDDYGFPLDIGFLSYAFWLEVSLNLATPRMLAL